MQIQRKLTIKAGLIFPIFFFLDVKYQHIFEKQCNEKKISNWKRTKNNCKSQTWTYVPYIARVTSTLIIYKAQTLAQTIARSITTLIFIASESLADVDGNSCASLWLLAARATRFSVLYSGAAGIRGITALQATFRLPSGKCWRFKRNDNDARDDAASYLSNGYCVLS